MYNIYISRVVLFLVFLSQKVWSLHFTDELTLVFAPVVNCKFPHGNLKSNENKTKCKMFICQFTVQYIIFGITYKTLQTKIHCVVYKSI